MNGPHLPTNDVNPQAQIHSELGPKLSSKASISHDYSIAPRWSEYHAPRPGCIVSVAEEQDVIETVRYCVKHNLGFLAQAGAHAWTTTLNIGANDVVINLRALNQAVVSADGSKLTFGGGTTVSEAVSAAAEKGVQIVTGNCNDVGMAGPTLGGGVGRLMGKFGMAVDNVLSANLVTASGELVTVTPTGPDPDLWWAIRGAGHNFGIVTSLTMRAHLAANGGMAWVGAVIFTPDKLEQLVQALSEIEFVDEMGAHLYFAATPPEFNQLAIVFVPWYCGTESEARKAWAPVLDVGPVVDMTEELPYEKWNASADFFCVKGARAFGYSSILKSLDPGTFRKTWNLLVDYFNNTPGAQQTTVMIECYSHKTSRTVPGGGTAYPHRDTNFFAIALPWHYDVGTDAAAEEFGSTLRELWFANSGYDARKVYVNFAKGDEDLREIYGENLPRLRAVKERWDPDGRFNHFFPID